MAGGAQATRGRGGFTRHAMWERTRSSGKHFPTPVFRSRHSKGPLSQGIAHLITGKNQHSMRVDYGKWSLLQVLEFGMAHVYIVRGVDGSAEAA